MIPQTHNKQQGVVLLMFALSLIVIISMLAIGVNVVHAAKKNIRLQQMTESAIVSTGLAGENLKAEERDQLYRYIFSAFYPKSFNQFSTLANGDDDLSIGHAHQYLMADWLTQYDIATSSQQEINLGIALDTQRGNIEVALVLDNSGSMYADIEALKDSAQLFIDELFKSRTHDEQIYISLVPFSNSVNLGKNRNHWFKGNFPDYADTHGVCPDFRYPFDVFGSEATNLLNNALIPPSKNRFPAVDADFSIFTCADAELTPLTNDKARLDQQIKKLVADGSTDGDHGILWGWRTLAEEWQETWTSIPKDRPAGKHTTTKKILVFFSDGAGISNQTQIFLPACERIKRDGIDIYAVQFSTNNSSMTRCVSQQSGKQFYHFANNQDQLKQAFIDISQSVGVELRLHAP